MRLAIRVYILVLAIFCIFAAPGGAANVAYVDNYNRVILNGQPFFPIGLYVVECTNGAYVDELDEIADSPFNTLMNYAVNACGSEASYQEIRDYLDEVARRDLKLIFSLKEYISACNISYGVCDDPGLGLDAENMITQKVTNHMDHDAIVAWYLNDETCPDCLEQLEDAYNLIKFYDKNHPVWSVHWNTSWLLQEVHTTDIVGVDSYPIPGNPITWVSNVADEAMEAGKPLWFVPQLFDQAGHAPTKEEMRAMTYLAVNHGARGLIYYSYFDIRGDADYQQRWDAIRDIADEIDQLRNIFLSTDQTNQNDITCNNPDIDFKLMRQGGTYYLFAVNTAVDAQGDPAPATDVSFRVNLRNVESKFDVLFENRKVTVNNGTFMDDFSGDYAVHVYQADTIVATNANTGGGGGGGGCFVTSLD